MVCRSITLSLSVDSTFMFNFSEFTLLFYYYLINNGLILLNLKKKRRFHLITNLLSYLQTPPVMPFYGNSVPGQPGSQMESGFGPPPMRDRFGGWPPQPGDPGTLNGLSSWSPAAPQSHNYMQQVPPHHPPPHQIDELRHYHPQYAATPAYQGAG